MRPAKVLSAALTLLCAIPIVAQIQQEKVDLDAIYRIKDEGLNRSRVMDTLGYLTDVYGARLTGSPQIKAAGEWAKKKLTEWELVNVGLETWGPFGRGWSNARLLIQVVSPARFPVIAYPKAWTPGTNGLAAGDAVIAVVNNVQDFDKFRGQLRGKYVLMAAMPEVQAQFQAPGRRFTDEELLTMSNQPIQPPRGGGNGQRGGGGGAAATPPNFNQQRLKFFIDEGAIATIEPGRGAGGTVFVQGGGGRTLNDPPVPAQIVMAVEHYGRIWRTLQKNVPVRIEMDIQNKFHDEDPNSFNIVGEIPGTDKADELVMLGAHFDSWHTGTGATDNAAGSAVMMEAMRILKASGLRMRRTVRIALWTGEEQGLLGSRAYVTQHFADRQNMNLKPDHSKFSAYFNVDNGTGAIRGVYLQGNEAVSPIFQAWMQPLRNMGMTTLTIRNTGGTDHTNFDAVGLPGFQFIQDPVEYDSRTHHSNMDVYERIQPADMMKNAVIVASFAYHAANRDEKLPRKPLPQPQPQANRN
ncbi:MAG: M20/M25/M40 family metallo-hydrolase [Acidobacteria bacterium]|nr:M20/M25/M40 family metallo-hydrolase [Acidobacteriota bacterium]